MCCLKCYFSSSFYFSVSLGTSYFTVQSKLPYTTKCKSMRCIDVSSYFRSCAVARRPGCSLAAYVQESWTVATYNSLNTWLIYSLIYSAFSKLVKDTYDSTLSHKNWLEEHLLFDLSCSTITIFVKEFQRYFMIKFCLQILHCVMSLLTCSRLSSYSREISFCQAFHLRPWYKYR